ncbi:copper resistance protein B [Oleiagrimonas citrea]|nr:copper resistance protein B [Oleiagrimonas citrea]
MNACTNRMDVAFRNRVIRATGLVVLMLSASVVAKQQVSQDHSPAPSTAPAVGAMTSSQEKADHHPCGKSMHPHADDESSMEACPKPKMDMSSHAMHMQHAEDNPARSPTIGSLPKSDGAAPEPYSAYGVTLHMPSDPLLSKFMLNSLEYVRGDSGSSQAWEVKAWAGHNTNRLWVRTEGARSGGRLEEGDAELLWGHAVSPFWDVMLGARHDLGVGPTRNWAALGIQGLAPYQFDFEGTVYLGPSGRSALRVRTSQEWLFTQRLILEPELELNAYGRGDPRRMYAAGLADTALSLRLRYEFSRKFAPYVGFAWTRKWGGTARMARLEGSPVTDHQLLAGLRIWF